MLLPDPPELLALAVRIAAHADAARGEADRLDAAVRAVTWQGLAATAFDGLAAELSRALRGTADRLDAAATALRHHAYAVQDTLDTLRRLAGDGVSLAHALAGGLLDEVTDPAALVGDAAGLLGATGHAISDVGHLIGIG